MRLTVLACHRLGRRTLILFLPQTMQVGDKIPHMGIIDRALCFGLPRQIGGFIVRKNAHNVQGGDILKDVLFGRDQLTAENKVQTLGHFENLGLGYRRGLIGLAALQHREQQDDPSVKPSCAA